MFLVDSPGYDERARELSKEAGPRSIQKASKLGQVAKAEVSKLDFRSQLGRRFEKLLLEYFENEVRAPSSAQLLMANSSPGLSDSCVLRVVGWSCI